MRCLFYRKGARGFWEPENYTPMLLFANEVDWQELVSLISVGIVLPNSDKPMRRVRDEDLIIDENYDCFLCDSDYFRWQRDQRIDGKSFISSIMADKLRGLRMISNRDLTSNFLENRKNMRNARETTIEIEDHLDDNSAKRIANLEI